MIELDFQWGVVSVELNGLIDDMMHRDSIALFNLVEDVFPLRARLEAGERSHQLYDDIQKIMERFEA